MACLLISVPQVVTTNLGVDQRVDEFSAIRCGEDVVTALVGRRALNGRVVEIEAAHRDIALKDLGASQVNNHLSLIAWSICGAEYQLLVSRGKVSDAIRFPSHSRRQPEFLGTCTLKGKALTDDVLAVLDNPNPRRPTEPPYRPDDATPLAAVHAWRIDEVRGRFVPLTVDGLRCPRGRIDSADGGL